MAGALQASGFTVIRRDNASLRDMQLAPREFGDKLGRGSVGLVCFAGHGVQVRGRNYLVPVDADIAREDEVSFSAIDLAADGSGRNGFYTHHLLREMARPGAAIEEVFKAVRASVRKDSAGKQVPWESTSLEAGFAFRDAPPVFAKGDRWKYRARNLLSGTERSFTLRVTATKGDHVLYDNGNVTDVVGNAIKGRSSDRATTYPPRRSCMRSRSTPGPAGTSSSSRIPRAASTTSRARSR